MKSMKRQLKDLQLTAMKRHGIEDIFKPGELKNALIADQLGHKKLKHRERKGSTAIKQGEYFKYLSARTDSGSRYINFSIAGVTADAIKEMEDNSCFCFAYFNGTVDIDRVIMVECKDIIEKIRDIYGEKKTPAVVTISSAWVEQNAHKTIRGV